MTIRTVTGIAAALALGLLAAPAQAGGYSYGHSYKDGPAPYDHSRGVSVRIYDAPPYYVPSYHAYAPDYAGYYRYDRSASPAYVYSHTAPGYSGYHACDCCCR